MPKDVCARVWTPAEGTIRWFPKIGLLKTSGQFGIPEGPMPELEGVPNSASLQLHSFTNWSQNWCEMTRGLASHHHLAYRELWSLYPRRVAA